MAIRVDIDMDIDCESYPKRVQVPKYRVDSQSLYDDSWYRNHIYLIFGYFGYLGYRFGAPEFVALGSGAPCLWPPRRVFWTAKSRLHTKGSRL